MFEELQAKRARGEPLTCAEKDGLFGVDFGRSAAVAARQPVELTEADVAAIREAFNRKCPAIVERLKREPYAPPEPDKES